MITPASPSEPDGMMMDVWNDMLDRLVGQPVPSGMVVGLGPHGLEVGFQLLQVDAIAVSVGELLVEAPQVTAAGVLDVRGWVDDICHRSTYLLEHLGVLEVDSLGGTVLARSVPPTKSGGTTHFYELRGMTPARLRFRRVQAGPSSPTPAPASAGSTSNSPTPASAPAPSATNGNCRPLVLTREVLGRWLDDVSAAGQRHLPGF